MECVIAPEFSKEAVAVLAAKKNLRILELDIHGLAEEKFDYKKVSGGLLLQEKDNRNVKTEEIKVVGSVKPTKSQMEAMLFGWKLIKHVK